MLIYYFGNWKFGCKDTTFNFKGKIVCDSKKYVARMNMKFIFKDLPRITNYCVPLLPEFLKLLNPIS
jgi:hypothetical protein